MTFTDWCFELDHLCVLHGLDKIVATGEYLSDDLREMFDDGYSPAEVLHEWRLENDSDTYGDDEIDDSWQDADTFTSIGWGTDEDYGYYGQGEEW